MLNTARGTSPSRGVFTTPVERGGSASVRRKLTVPDPSESAARRSEIRRRKFGPRALCRPAYETASSASEETTANALPRREATRRSTAREQSGDCIVYTERSQTRRTARVFVPRRHESVVDRSLRTERLPSPGPGVKNKCPSAARFRGSVRWVIVATVDCRDSRKNSATQNRRSF